jgi:hypothetical protein
LIAIYRVESDSRGADSRQVSSVAAKGNRMGKRDQAATKNNCSCGVRERIRRTALANVTKPRAMQLARPLYEKRADAKVSVNCSNCATPIIKRKTELIRSKDLFCNRECKAQWVSKNKAGENHPLWEDKAVEFACRYCGVVFKAYQRHRRGERAYCSKDCATNDGRTVRECGWCCESFAVKVCQSNAKMYFALNTAGGNISQRLC